MSGESWASSPGTRRSMLGNRATGTKPEVALRSALHRRGYRFRKNLRLTVGTVSIRPDIVFPRRKVAVFVDGCFWHGCPLHGRPPKTNDWYWGPKLSGNRERDARNVAALQAAGWRVLRFWEHEALDDAVDEVCGVVSDQCDSGPNASS